MNVSSPHVLIMAGGTGGHVFPALAVARELIARGATVSWLGTSAGIEARLVPAEGLTLHRIDVGGLRGKHLTTLLAAPTSMARALWQARRVLKAVRPALVIGMGGFASGPGGLMARMTGTPLLIHEQNAAAGLTNRVLARLAQTVLQAFPNTFDADTQPADGRQSGAGRHPVAAGAGESAGLNATARSDCLCSAAAAGRWRSTNACRRRWHSWVRRRGRRCGIRPGVRSKRPRPHTPHMAWTVAWKPSSTIWPKRMAGPIWWSVVRGR